MSSKLMFLLYSLNPMPLSPSHPKIRFHVVAGAAEYDGFLHLESFIIFSSILTVLSLSSGYIGRQITCPVTFSATGSLPG